MFIIQKTPRWWLGTQKTTVPPIQRGNSLILPCKSRTTAIVTIERYVTTLYPTTYAIMCGNVWERNYKEFRVGESNFEALFVAESVYRRPEEDALPFTFNADVVIENIGVRKDNFMSLIGPQWDKTWQPKNSCHLFLNPEIKQALYEFTDLKAASPTIN